MFLTCQIDHFRYAYTEFDALREVRFSVDTGERVGVVGHSGCGKTTLALTLTGFIPQLVRGELKGIVALNGHDAASAPLWRLSETAGLVMQEPQSQLFCSTVEDELAFGLEASGLPVSESRCRLADVVERFDLGTLLRKAPHQLSGGQQKLVAFAAIYARYPACLLMDGGLTGLDSRNRANVVGALKKWLHEFGGTLILFGPPNAMDFSLLDRILELDDGRLSFDGSVRDWVAWRSAEREVSGLPEITQAFAWLARKSGKAQVLPLNRKEAEPILSESWIQKSIRVATEHPITDDGVASTHGDTIELRNISFTYPKGPPVFRNLTVSLAYGTSVALMGANASGKSTLAKLLVDVLKPDRGTIQVIGPRRTNRSDCRTVDARLVLQNPDHQLFGKTCLEDVRLGIDQLAEPPDDPDGLTRQALQLFQLADKADEPPWLMSRGQRFRLATAAAMVTSPEMLIFDEPTPTISEEEFDGIMRVIAHEELAPKPTMFIISHDLSVVFRFCARIIILRDGEVAFDGSPRALFDRSEALELGHIRPNDLVELAHNSRWEPFQDFCLRFLQTRSF